MSFNKKFVDKEKIKHYLDNGLELKKLFNSDTIIFLDEISCKVFKWFIKGIREDEIKVKLDKNG